MLLFSNTAACIGISHAMHCIALYPSIFSSSPTSTCFLPDHSERANQSSGQPVRQTTTIVPLRPLFRSFCLPTFVVAVPSSFLPLRFLRPSPSSFLPLRPAHNAAALSLPPTRPRSPSVPRSRPRRRRSLPSSPRDSRRLRSPPRIKRASVPLLFTFLPPNHPTPRLATKRPHRPPHLGLHPDTIPRPCQTQSAIRGHKPRSRVACGRVCGGVVSYDVYSTSGTQGVGGRL